MKLADKMKDLEYRQAYNGGQVRVAVALGLRRYREKKKLTQTAVAEAADLSQSQVARAEHPDKGITLDQLVRVADGMGLVPIIRFIKSK